MASKWFRPRRYGYGSTPVTWQGWALIFMFPLICAAVALLLVAILPPLAAIIIILLFIAAAVPAFITLVKRRTDGDWRCRE